MTLLLALLLAVTPINGNRSAQTGSFQGELLVLTTATSVSVGSGTKSLELFNNGPNTIWCNPIAAAVVNKSRPIPPGGRWVVDANASALAMTCICSAAQVTGAATILTTIQ